MKPDYKEINYYAWQELYYKDRLGYYCTITDTCKWYRKDELRHNEYGAAVVYFSNNNKEYWLNNKRYLDYNHFSCDVLVDSSIIASDENWAKYCKLKVFQ